MTESTSNGQKRPRPGRETLTVDVLGLGAAVTITLGGVMLLAGLSSAMTSGYKVGPYAGFAGGLTAIIIATTLVNGGIAFMCHRLHVNARDELIAETHEANRNCRTIIAMLAERNTSDDDQVGAARRGHEG